MIRYFILGFFFSISVIFIGHNIAEYNRSFDNCERLVAEINKTFGRLLFISDNVNDFSSKQLDFLNEIYTRSDKQ